MRTLLLLLLLAAPLPASAQLEISVTAGSEIMLFGFSPKAPPVFSGNAGRSEGPTLPIGIEVGLDFLWRTPERTLAPFVHLAYGGLLSSGGLTNQYRGTGSQLSDVNRMGDLIAQTRLQDVSFAQLTLGTEFLHAPRLRGLRLGAGIGGYFVLRERVHAAVSWVDPDTGLAEPAELQTWVEDNRLVQQVNPATLVGSPGALQLSENMLRRFTPYAEFRLGFRAGGGGPALIALQYGLRPIIDEARYNDPPAWKGFLNIKFVVRGLVFSK